VKEGPVLKEFREFVTRGNVLDLAVGVMIGAAFNKIVDSLVKDIIMPPIGVILGGIDFSNFFLNLSGTSYNSLADAQQAGAATVNYGLFINNVISFFIVAFAIFMLVKQVNRLRRPRTAEPNTQKECPFCRLNMPLAASRCPHCTSELQHA
jgi:large conductance mechanosensitive channel